MARRVFHSFHFARDSQRVAKVKNMGVVEGQPLLSGNQWEAVKKGGDPAIRKWINDQMAGKSCVIVLIGSQTAGRKWVNYEIKKAWGDKRGLVGVYIHGLTDLDGYQDSKGANPFAEFNVGGTNMASIVPVAEPPFSDSKAVYAYIKQNLEGWVEQGMTARNAYS